MIKIGDFSKLSQVSVKALRYYDEMGLLKPVEVDRFTAYRYYAIDQLPQLNRILALKDLGFSLEQVRQVLEEGVTPEQLRGMFRLKRAEQHERLQEEQERLARVEARLRQIEQEQSMSTYDIVIKKIEPQTVASVRKTIPAPQDIGHMFETLFGYLGMRGVKPAGAPIAIWHDTEHREKDWDTELVVPIAEALPAGNGVQALQLPGVAAMATTIHQGPYEGFSQAYAALMQWIEANGYRLAGPTREIYLRGPSPETKDPAAYITEIQAPVEKA